MKAIPTQLRLLRLRGLLFGAVLVLAMGISSAGAYVLEGPHVLELMVKKLKGPTTLQVLQHVTIEDPLVAPQPVTLNENLYYSYPDRFRSETQYNETQRILVSTPGQILTVVDNTIAANKEGRFDRYKDPLLFLGRNLMHKVLSSHGVDIGVTSLGRRDDQLAWIIGAQYPDDTRSQIWIDKERFVPVRWISIIPGLLPSQPPDRLEFVYSNWQKQGGVWYPHLIETYHNQQRIRVARVQEIRSNVTLQAEMFNIAHLMSIYPSADAQTQQQPDPTPMDEVDRTIDDFKKKFEP